MKKIESSNPAMGQFKKQGSVEKENAMTVKGTTNKLMFLLTIVFISSMLSWQYVANNPDHLYPTIILGALVGFAMSIVIIVKPTLSPILTPIYAVIEGLFLGPITMYFEAMYPGIGVQAVVVTIGIFIGMLLIYGYRIIRVTEKLTKIVVGLTLGIMIVYIISIVARLLGSGIPLIHEGGVVGIGFSLFVIAVAAFNLLLDFKFIEDGQENNVPKYMEWYGAFGLLVTIVWLYIEVLKLLAKLRSGD